MTSLQVRLHSLHLQERRNPTCEWNFSVANSDREVEGESKRRGGVGAVGGRRETEGREGGEGSGERSNSGLFRAVRSFKEILKRFRKKIATSR